MDFDDPLADILSDDSNDSFFNDDRYKKKKPQISDVNLKKNDLFGIEIESKLVTNVDLVKDKSTDDWLGLEKGETKNINPKFEIKPVSNVDIQKSSDNVFNIQENLKQKEMVDLSNPLDFLDELELPSAKKLRKQESNSKEMLNIDELLGPRNQSQGPFNNILANEKKSISFANYTPTSNTSKKEINSDIENKPKIKNVVKEITEKSKQSDEVRAKGTFKSENKENRLAISKDNVSSKRQKPNKDWLGIFSDANEDFIESNKDKTESLTNLLAQSSNEAKLFSAQENALRDDVEQKNNNSDNHPKKIITPEKSTLEIDNQLGLKTFPEIISNPVFSMVNDINIEQQSAAICLQQQESHLMVALQMKAQEEKLAAMHERQEEARRVQQEVVSAHREQLNNILKRQTNHRLQLQSIIGEHQERINNHIELLLKPSHVTNIYNDNIENLREKNLSLVEDTFRNSKINENSRLKIIINNIQENYEKEIELMENAYKRQISVLQESLNNLETRNETEIEKNSQYLQKQIDKLEQDKVKISDYYEAYIGQMAEKQKDEIKKIESKHVENMEVIQKQHHLVINNIRDTMQLEKETLRGATDYSQRLNHLLDDVQQNNKICQNVMEKIENISELNNLEKNNHLKSKEDYLNKMLDNLEKHTKIYENESTDTKILLQTFEQRLNQQKIIIDEERQQIKQKEVELLKEKDIMKMEYEQLKQKLEYEKEIFKNASAEFEKMNTNARTDIEKKIKKIEEDSSSLKNDSKILQESKAEIKMLKLDLENEIKEFNNKKKSLQTKEDMVHQNEIMIMERSNNLEVLTRNALAKQKYAESKFSEALYAQQRYEEKLARFQEQSLSLNEREQQLSKEKVALSRERLLLYNQRSESEYNICAICRTSNIPQILLDNSSFKHHNEHGNTSISVLDNISKLKLFENKLDNKNLKEIKDDLNNLDRRSHNLEYNNETMNRFLNNEYNTNIPPKFRETVDPKLMALKYDLFETNKYL